MMRRIIGIIMIIGGSFFVFPFLALLPRFMGMPRDNARQIGTFIGFGLGLVLTLTVILTLIFFGARFVRKRQA